MTDDELIDAYVKHVSRTAESEDDYFWAWETITDLIDSDPERAWRLLLEAIARCPRQHEHYVGAGPLEELLVKYPRQFVELVATELVGNSRFRTAFSVIRFSTEYTTDEDAAYFNQRLRFHGIASVLIPVWRLVERDDAV